MTLLSIFRPRALFAPLSRKGLDKINEEALRFLCFSCQDPAG